MRDSGTQTYLLTEPSVGYRVPEAEAAAQLMHRATAVLLKPFDIDDLLTCIARLCPEYQPEVSTPCSPNAHP